ncbi:HPr kinase/phosphorylase [Hoeflea olei]|uniref:HPr kinase/phosphorylase C-terminal domain-containing protein n=1 Tax=Hoeflea olei TaxID=1480615 RepID=A0A1C1YRP3_9HYPH|nr:HPr kinase/phosphatase C-terminal domain-containing protein [Hoeflea olei]OCW56040.1 hypothetical protein AWJ14_12565 [Hoeflea olei]
MTGEAASGTVNLHATAIVVGATGLLFLGPSGAGKSRTAFACLAQARARGWHAALVADDRTLVTPMLTPGRTPGAGRLIASCPAPLEGLVELRGTGIVTVPRTPRAVLDLAVALEAPSAEGRLPPENETFSCAGTALPLLRLWADGAADPLSRILAGRPALFSAR